MISRPSRNLGSNRYSRSITGNSVEAASEGGLNRGGYALGETPDSDHIVGATGGR
jgi:hypothetical protein